MSIVWIVSYPKSGNTWLRFLLANYLAGAVEDTEHLERLVPNFTLPVDRTDLVRRAVTLYAKSHYPWGPRHPYAAESKRAVALVRNPRDVLLSGLDYQRLIGLRADDVTDADYVRAFVHYGGDPSWIARGYGALEEHADTWLAGLSGKTPPHMPPTLIVRYENLKADTIGELARVIRFLELPFEESRVHDAVSRSQFERLRDIEIRERDRGSTTSVFPGGRAGPDNPRFFLSKGRVGSSLSHLGAELEAEFEARFGALIRRLGYGQGDRAQAQEGAA